LGDLTKGGLTPDVAAVASEGRLESSSGARSSSSESALLLESVCESGDLITQRAAEKGLPGSVMGGSRLWLLPASTCMTGMDSVSSLFESNRQHT
jgi:hypothetical protein